MWVTKKTLRRKIICLNEVYTDKNLMVKSTIFNGKPEPLGISAG